MDRLRALHGAGPVRPHAYVPYTESDWPALHSALLTQCALMPIPVNSGGMIQLSGDRGCFNLLPPMDVDWLNGAMTPEEYAADVTAIVCAGFRGLIAAGADKNHSFTIVNGHYAEMFAHHAKNAAICHAAAQAHAELLSARYAEEGRRVVWRYQKLPDEVDSQEAGRAGGREIKFKSPSQLCLLCKPTPQ